MQRLLWQWFVVGGVVMACFPTARGDSELMGYLPLWLVGAPLLSLLVFHRSAIATMVQWAMEATPRRRRPRTAVAQARRLGFGRGGRKSVVRAA